MARRTKLDFEPLSVEETAEGLGIPRGRAEKILTLVGVDTEKRTTTRITRGLNRRSGRKSTRRVTASR